MNSNNISNFLYRNKVVLFPILSVIIGVTLIFWPTDNNDTLTEKTILLFAILHVLLIFIILFDSIGNKIDYQIKNSKFRKFVKYELFDDCTHTEYVNMIEGACLRIRTLQVSMNVLLSCWAIFYFCQLLSICIPQLLSGYSFKILYNNFFNAIDTLIMFSMWSLMTDMVKQYNFSTFLRNNLIWIVIVGSLLVFQIAVSVNTQLIKEKLTLDIISGLLSGISFALFFSRLNSILLRFSNTAIFILMSYAVWQVSAPFINLLTNSELFTDIMNLQSFEPLLLFNYILFFGLSISFFSKFILAELILFDFNLNKFYYFFLTCLVRDVHYQEFYEKNYFDIVKDLKPYSFRNQRYSEDNLDMEYVQKHFYLNNIDLELPESNKIKLNDDIDNVLEECILTVEKGVEHLKTNGQKLKEIQIKIAFEKSCN